MEEVDGKVEPVEVIALEVLQEDVEPPIRSENSAGCKKKIFKFIIAALHIIFVIFGSYKAYTLYNTKFHPNLPLSAHGPREFTEKRMLKSINFSVNPCTNFYEFACGNWIQQDTIPSHMFRTSTSTELEIKLLRKIESFLNQPNSQHEPLAVHEARKMYKSCVGPNKLFRRMSNETRDKIPRFQKLAKILKKLHLPVVPNFSKKNKKFSWVFPAARSKKLLNHNFFIQFTIRADPFIVNSNRIYITNPSSRFYSSFDRPYNEYAKSRSSFYKFLKNVVTYMYEKSKLKWTAMTRLSYHHRFSKLLKFARRVEEIDFSCNNSYLAQYTSIDDLQRMTDVIFDKNKNSKIDWKVYFEEMFKGSSVHFNLRPDDKLILVPDQDYLVSIFKLLAKTPPHIIELHMWWKTMFDIIPFSNIFLSGKYNEYYVNFFHKQRPPRDLYCADLVNHAFRYATSYFIVQDDVTRQKMSKISDMTENIRSTFADKIKNLPWLDENTRSKAIQKLNSTKTNIGYPEWMNDSQKIDQYYDKLQMNECDLMGNVLKVKEKNFRRMLDVYHIENDHEKENRWIGHVLQVNAFYDSFYNTITIPAGLMSYPFYDLGIEAMNYGAVGMIIGHELTHGFDESGKEFDNEGHLRSWWSYRTNLEYEKKAQCFVHYYNEYSFNIAEDRYSALTAQMDGQLTLNENIADHGGLRIAFKAYQNYIKNYGEEKLLSNFNFTAEQLYFLAFAQSRCEHMSNQLLKLRLTDEHGSNVIRLLTTLSNTQEFADAWKCELGSPMNPNEKKCQLW